MKYWLSHLPSEVWVDVFRLPGKSRQELGQMVDRIGNYKFAEYLQFYLHDWGKRTLKGLIFDETGLYTWIEDEDDDDDEGQHRHHLEIPQTPLPANIRSFECIHINYFDARTIAFLGQIRPLLTDLEIELPSDFVDQILANLVPLLDTGTIRSLTHFHMRDLPTVREHLRDEQLDNLKVLKMRHGFEHDEVRGGKL